jgi:RHH-type proline utilization regulon transcriptional repressor/proline dehydrogenase/delta 1-pyrroline-5-carboxylate dehydrogenase
MARDGAVAKGHEIFRLMESAAPPLFDRKSWAGRLMGAAMDRPDFKLALFRFIDVLPSLSTRAQLARHLREYFLEEGAPFADVAGGLFSSLAGGVAGSLAAAAAAPLVRREIEAFSRTFIAGRDPADALPVLAAIRAGGGCHTVDLLGEAALSVAETDRYGRLYLELVRLLAREIASRPPRDPEREKAFPGLNLSVKLSSLCSRLDPARHDDSVAEGVARLRPVFRAVREAGGALLVDMETTQLKAITLDAVTALLDEEEFLRFDRAGVALQMYLRSAEEDLDRVAGWARARGRRITVRLVKGAYWEYERAVALQRGWPVPVFLEKSHTDASFERNVERALAAHGHVTTAVASHNVRTLAFALDAAERLSVPRDRYEFQALYGMAGPVKEALSKLGHPVREYVPVGELIPGMAYLVRRLLENTSNEGFLRRTFAEGADREALLATPEPCPPPAPPPPPRRAGEGPFANEPPLDFSVPADREGMARAVEEARRRLGRHLPAVVAGREHRGGEELRSVDPTRPSVTVCTASAADGALAGKAVEAADAGRVDWARRPPRERAAILYRAAAIARRRRFELAAWQVAEVGKGWAEADADVCEAVDHLEYYGREMERLSVPRRLGSVPGEVNRYLYQPRGVGAVVAPWNFPLAISVGMVSAALVTGNAVVYKPSTLSLLNGWIAFDLLREAGVPEPVLHFLPGRGSVAGDRIVEHPRTDFVLFTGSLEVGLGIVERAGRTSAGQRGPKKAVIETGGKNAVVVDADADLDQAVPAVIRSAFGFQGQKCSACSRVVVVADCYDRFLSRLSEAVSDLRVGDPADPANDLGPVVDRTAVERIARCVEEGAREGTVVVRGEVGPGEGYFVPPVVLADLPPSSRLLREEIFGPVLSVVRAKDLEEAIAVAVGSEYALTGGLFSRSPASIALASRDFSVGNLYINRGITGAIVGRQPFGGFRMSGVGSKAGGPDYLPQFMEPRVVTENTLRRGFTPEDVLPGGTGEGRGGGDG